MTQLIKQGKRAVRRVTSAFAAAIVSVTPSPIRKLAAPYVSHAEMLFSDHVVLRYVYPNKHRLSDEACRSAQPLPSQIHRFARQGIRTIVNLRGPSTIGSYVLEKKACEEAGIKLVDFRVRSRAAPTKEQLLGARDLLNSIEYPMVLHCKSGADRAGLMSVLYMHVRQNMPIDQAIKQLSIYYGHIRQADTGILDHVFEQYMAYAAKSPLAFYDWVEQIYDPAETARSFKAKGWANRIVNEILNRE